VRSLQNNASRQLLKQGRWTRAERPPEKIAHGLVEGTMPIVTLG
jgi:hypothetical protein